MKIALTRYFILSLFVLTLYQGLMPVNAQPARCDRECVSTIRGLLQERKSGFYLSWLEKANRQLGDSVSVGLQKVFTKRYISRPKNVKLFLPVILEAFKDTEMISKTNDKTPTATMRLLTTLRWKVKDASIRNEIIKTINEIASHTNYGVENRAPS